jgi:hypothetical protein
MKSRVQIPLPALASKNFLASQMSISSEPSQRTDISVQPLVPNFFVETFLACRYIPKD